MLQSAVYSNSSTSLLLRPGQGVVRTEPVCVKVTPKETSLHGHWPGGGGANTKLITFYETSEVP